MGFDDLRQQSLAVQEQQYAAPPQSLMDRMPLFKDLKPKERFIIALFIFCGSPWYFSWSAFTCGCRWCMSFIARRLDWVSG